MSGSDVDTPFQLLFTVGMTLVDSIDSIIMLYSYAGFPERGFALFEPRTRAPSSPQTRTPLEQGPDASKGQAIDVAEVDRADVDIKDPLERDPEKAGTVDAVDARADINEPVHQRTLRVKHNAVSNLSILLTLMSIMVAFRYATPRVAPLL